MKGHHPRFCRLDAGERSSRSEFVKRRIPATPELKAKVGYRAELKANPFSEDANGFRREISLTLAPLFLQKGLSRHRRFESTSLRQRVCSLLVRLFPLVGQ